MFSFLVMKKVMGVNCLIRKWVNGFVFVKGGFSFDWKLFMCGLDFLDGVGLDCSEKEDCSCGDLFVCLVKMF